MSIIGRVAKMIVGNKAQDRSKLAAENQQTLVGIEQLAKKVGVSNQNDQLTSEYMQRLRKEGGGF